MPAHLLLDRDQTINAMRDLLNNAMHTLSPEDHLAVLEATADHIDEKLDAHADGCGRGVNLPTKEQG